MDAETRRRAVIDLALEYSNLKQKANDIGVIDIDYRGRLQMDSEEFFKSFGTECKVITRDSDLFPYEAYAEFYSGKVFAVLTKNQFKKLSYGVAADE